MYIKSASGTDTGFIICDISKTVAAFSSTEKTDEIETYAFLLVIDNAALFEYNLSRPLQSATTTN